MSLTTGEMIGHTIDNWYDLVLIIEPLGDTTAQDGTILPGIALTIELGHVIVSSSHEWVNPAVNGRNRITDIVILSQIKQAARVISNFNELDVCGVGDVGHHVSAEELDQLSWEASPRTDSRYLGSAPSTIREATHP